jgi:UDP-glucose 4,6-dehydratase
VPRNILLTGGAGFVGSHVVVRLVQKYPQYKVRPRSQTRCDASVALVALMRRAPAQVVVLDKLDYCASLRNLAAVSGCPNLKARTRCATCAAPPPLTHRLRAHTLSFFSSSRAT